MPRTPSTPAREVACPAGHAPANTPCKRVGKAESPWYCAPRRAAAKLLPWPSGPTGAQRHRRHRVVATRRAALLAAEPHLIPLAAWQAAHPKAIEVFFAAERPGLPPFLVALRHLDKEGAPWVASHRAVDGDLRPAFEDALHTLALDLRLPSAVARLERLVVERLGCPGGRLGRLDDRWVVWDDTGALAYGWSVAGGGPLRAPSFASPCLRVPVSATRELVLESLFMDLLGATEPPSENKLNAGMVLAREVSDGE